MLLLTGEGGGWGEQREPQSTNISGMVSNRRARISKHGAMDTWENRVSQKSWEDSFPKEDMVSSV